LPAQHRLRCANSGSIQTSRTLVTQTPPDIITPRTGIDFDVVAAGDHGVVADCALALALRHGREQHHVALSTMEQPRKKHKRSRRRIYFILTNLGSDDNGNEDAEENLSDNDEDGDD